MKQAEHSDTTVHPDVESSASSERVRKNQRLTALRGKIMKGTLIVLSVAFSITIYVLANRRSNIAYQISNPLSVQFDVSLLHSPFNNIGGNFANNISGIYLTRAELNYRPSKNMLLQIQYRQLPAMYWLNNYDRFGFMPLYDRIDEEESH